MGSSSDFHTRGQGVYFLQFNHTEPDMRTLILAVILATFPYHALAQQQCASGVYLKAGTGLTGASLPPGVRPTDPIYTSIHVNGAWMVMTFLNTKAVSGVTIPVTGYTASGGRATPQQLGLWDYLVGSWDGSAYRLTGLQVYGACAVTARVSCDVVGNATYTIDAMDRTITATDYGANCAKMQTDSQSVEPAQRYGKIF